MPLISITRLRVRSWWFFPAFIFAAIRSARQARRAEGNLAVKLLKDARNTWWTSTAWDSEASMRRFMLARPHGPAMRKLLEWCDDATLVHWTQPTAELPSWPEARRRMQSEGRHSKVNHPARS
jgi:heme-degrading monooxygenase HmoA